MHVMPAAVIFDVDGLLVDTETCDFHAWRDLHRHHGRDLTLEEFAYSAGLHGCWEQMYAALEAATGETAEALHAWRQPRFRRLVEDCLHPSPSLLALLEFLEEQETALGVASSSDEEWVEWLLGGLGLRHRFRAVASGTQVERRKPAPDVYLLAARRLEADPARCVALEDSIHGIQAARAAGMRVIAIPNLISSGQDLSAADARVRDFSEVTPQLLARLAGLPRA